MSALKICTKNPDTKVSTIHVSQVQKAIRVKTNNIYITIHKYIRYSLMQVSGIKKTSYKNSLITF